MKTYCTATGLQVSMEAQEDPRLPTVVVLATGGTIAGIGAEGKTVQYTPGQLDVHTLCAGVPGMAALANVRGVQVCNINSDDITAAHWLLLARTINDLAQDAHIDGFVVTHGTDTLDETSYFLNLTVKTQKPVVLTGSMRPATALSPDGPMNLYQAVALAGNAQAVGAGVMVVFSDHIFDGRDVQKVDTHFTASFNEKNPGCLGYMLDDVPYFFNHRTHRHTVQSEFDVQQLQTLPQVAVAYFHVDADPGVLEYYVRNGARGIVIAGAGAGEYSEAWNEKIASLVQAGISVVRCSRIAAGLIAENRRYHGEITAGGDLPPQKAAVLLRLALAQSSDAREIQRMIRTY